MVTDIIPKIFNAFYNSTVKHNVLHTNRRLIATFIDVKQITEKK